MKINNLQKTMVGIVALSIALFQFKDQLAKLLSGTAFSFTYATYLDKDYGVSIDYPDSWAIKEQKQQNGKIIYITANEYLSNSKDTYSHFSMITALGEMNDEEVKMSIEETKKVLEQGIKDRKVKILQSTVKKINGRDAIYFKGIHEQQYEDGKQIEVESYAFMEGKKLVNATFHYHPDKLKSYQSTYDKILKSIKL